MKKAIRLEDILPDFTLIGSHEDMSPEQSCIVELTKRVVELEKAMEKLTKGDGHDK